MFRKIIDAYKRRFARTSPPAGRTVAFTLPDFERPMRKTHADAKPKGYAVKRRRLREIQQESRRRNRR